MNFGFEDLTRRRVGSALLLSALLFALPAAGEVIFNESCFPTCDVTDGRFLIIAGGASLETLADEPLRLKFAVDMDSVDPGNPTFRFEIFDGDSNGVDALGRPHWDVGLPVDVYYRLFAIETLPDGSSVSTPVPSSKIQVEAGPVHDPTVAPFAQITSAQMFDNDWFTVTVEVGPEAQSFHSGNYFYALEIERDPTAVFGAGRGLLNAIKLRTDASVFLSLLEQPFAFEAKWASLVYDVPMVYPAFNFDGECDLFSFPIDSDCLNPVYRENSRYDGAFSFFLNVPAPLPGETREELTIFDGDLDHGGHDGTSPDVDDADTCYPVDPSGCAEEPLPFAPGGSVDPEGAAGALPHDDVDPASFFGFGAYNLRSPDVRYRIVFPQNTDPGNIQCRSGESVEGLPFEGRRTIVNLNPSGNQEWEKFTISTTDPGADCRVDSIPSGIYQVDLVGMDMNNLNAWYFGELVCGVQPASDPFCPVGTYLVGDTVWLDLDGDGNGDPAEIAADGEPGVPGVVIRLLDALGVEVGRTLTDADGIYDFSVEAGEYTVELAAANFVSSEPLGAVGDRVWLDDGDGFQDPGEPGIPSVRVNLYDAGPDGGPGGGNDVFLDFTDTDVNGHYVFMNLPPGTYYTTVVDMSLPDGLALSGGTDPSAPRTITGGEVFLDLDFGYAAAPGTVAVGDFVWHDVDGDGVQDPGEPGISGVTLKVSDSGGAATTAATTTGGFYLVTGLAPDFYTVQVTDAAGVLAGYVQTGDPDEGGTCGICDATGTSAVLAPGSSDLTLDFGYLSGGGVDVYSISDAVWHDRDRDGQFDADETGFAGVSVTLFGPDGSPVAVARTAADGSFSFAALPDGSYSLFITDLDNELTGLLPTTLPALAGSRGATLAGADIAEQSFGYAFDGALRGLSASTASPAQTDVVVDCLIVPPPNCGNVLTYDFGYRPGSIGDRVWLDRDGDGLQDADEPGIDGVTVVLRDEGGDVVATAITAGDGIYTFDAVAGGTYTVEVDATTLPGVYRRTFDLDGVGTPDTATFELGPAEDRTDVDFGYEPGSIGDTVFVDNDRDGIYEPELGEVGLSGVFVELYDAGGALVASTTTATGGFYLFGDLDAGLYRVVIPVGNFGGALSGYFQVSDPDGTLDNLTEYALAAAEDFLAADFGYLLENRPGTGTPGYWKNHPDAWPVDEITLGGVTYSKAEAIFILDQGDKHDKKSGDKTYTLGAALITAKLNALNGSDTSCISDVMALADAWFERHPVGSNVRGHSQAWKEAEPWYWEIDDYNNGRLCEPARD